MDRMLIVKTGTTLPEIAARRGDFEDWFAAGLRLDAHQMDVAEVFRGAPLPEPKDVPAVVVTGSAAMASAHEAWSDRTAHWLAQVVFAERPVLAVCYGHQLLALGLGGEVAANPRGREIGTVQVRLRDGAGDDPLFAELPPSLTVQATHQESVVRLPRGAVHLAHNEQDPHQAFRVGARAWGVQFHPEFDADVIRGYIGGRRKSLVSEGLNPDALTATASDSDHGQRLLGRFAELALG
jgi:GMP synthase (glutamine-hydrolysing)